MFFLIKQCWLCTFFGTDQRMEGWRSTQLGNVDPQKTNSFRNHRSFLPLRWWGSALLYARAGAFWGGEVSVLWHTVLLVVAAPNIPWSMPQTQNWVILSSYNQQRTKGLSTFYHERQTCPRKMLAGSDIPFYAEQACLISEKGLVLEIFFEQNVWNHAGWSGN